MQYSMTNIKPLKLKVVTLPWYYLWNTMQQKNQKQLNKDKPTSEQELYLLGGILASYKH